MRKQSSKAGAKANPPPAPPQRNPQRLPRKKKPWHRNVAIVGTLVGVVVSVVCTAVAVFFNFGSVQQRFGLNASVGVAPVVTTFATPSFLPTDAHPDLILCMTSAEYKPDPKALDHDIRNPIFLKTNFVLVNRGSVTAPATFVHILLTGPGKDGNRIQNSVEWTPTHPPIVVGNSVVTNNRVSTVVGIIQQIGTFLEASSQVYWSVGGAQKRGSLSGAWRAIRGGKTTRPVPPFPPRRTGP